MDDPTLESLRAALAATPDNHALLGVVIQALGARGAHADIIALLPRTPPEALPPDARVHAARAYLASGDASAALPWTEGDDPALAVVRARVLLTLGDRDAAREAYHDALARNPTVEDPDLAAQLAAATDASAPHGLRLLRGGEVQDAPGAAPLFAEADPVTFADVGGMADLKERIRRTLILPQQRPSLFQRFKKRRRSGLLLYGAPGCGKTLMAKATAGEVGCAFFNVQVADILNMWMGESEQRLSAAFEEARRHAPAVLFFDEVEALGAKRRPSTSSSSANLVSVFLSELDGFSSSDDGVLILAATNTPWAVDPAFRRPGRFDRVLFVPPPDREARHAILSIHLRDRPVADGLPLSEVAKATSGFSGADLEFVVETAADLAIAASLDAGSEVPIDATHLRAALDDVKPTTTEWLTTARNYARYANDGGQYDEVLKFLQQHGTR